MANQKFLVKQIAAFHAKQEALLQELREEREKRQSAECNARDLKEQLGLCPSGRVRRQASACVERSKTNRAISH